MGIKQGSAHSLTLGPAPGVLGTAGGAAAAWPHSRSPVSGLWGLWLATAYLPTSTRVRQTHPLPKRGRPLPEDGCQVPTRGSLLELERDPRAGLCSHPELASQAELSMRAPKGPPCPRPPAPAHQAVTSFRVQRLVWPPSSENIKKGASKARAATSTRHSVTTLVSHLGTQTSRTRV